MLNPYHHHKESLIKLLPALLALLIAGCSTAPSPLYQKFIVIKETLNASYDDTWYATMDVLISADYVIKLADKDGGYIVTEEKKGGRHTSGFMECGSQPLDIPRGATNIITVTLRDLGDDRTLIKPKVTGNVIKQSMVDQREYIFICYSTGLTERLFLDELRNRLSD